MTNNNRPRLRAHVVAPIPVALGVAMLGATSSASGQAQDDHFEAVQRYYVQQIGNVRDNDTVDPSLVVTWALAQHGIAQISADGEVYYLARSGSCATGSDRIDYMYDDGTNGVAYVALRSPTEPDEFTVRAGEALQLDVRANDTIQENLLPVISFTTPAAGTLTQQQPGTGEFEYVAPGTSGPQSFTYTSLSDAAACGPRVESVLVNVLPNAINDTLYAEHATEACVDVLANDMAAANGLQVVGFTTPGHGAVTLTPPGQLCYTGDEGYRGADSFDYTLQDRFGENAVATVDVFVFNAPPIANPDPVTTTYGVVATGNVLANDTDPNNDSLTVTAYGQPAHGSVDVAPNGDFTYTPDAGFSGADSFPYTADDGNGDHANSFVSIMVQPNAKGDTLYANHATQACVDVLANDEAFANGLQVVGFTTPDHGAITLNPPGEFCYTGDVGYRGADSFDYTLQDIHGGSAVATVNVNVFNAAPVATPDTAGTVAGVAATGNVLANDSDPNNDSLTVVANTSPAHGSVDVAADGAFTYTPEAGFSGDDSFQYTADDGFGGQANSIVHITVTPVANDDSFSVGYEATITDNLLANDLGSGLQVVSNTPPANGSASIAADGSFSYTAGAGFSGNDSLVYTVADATGRQSTATATFAVAASATIDVVSGDPTRQATVGTAFAQALEIRVLRNGAPLAGERVCFVVQPAGNGASATLSATEVVTNADGVASVTATPNAIPGSYVVTAALCSDTAVLTAFAMQNLAGPAAPIPTLGHGMLAMLAALLGWLGLRRRREV